MALIKRSRQREAILSELCGRTDHPTAEELYLSLKRGTAKPEPWHGLS
ncbi:MAG: hypothetical protein ACLVJ7_15705 [Acutalibacteraceae bacterium]